MLNLSIIQKIALEILEKSPQAIIVIHRDGEIAYASRKVEAVFGYKPDELVGRPHDILVSEEFRAQCNENLQKFFADKKDNSANTDLRFLAIHRNGSRFPVEANLISVTEERKTYVICIAKDLSRQEYLDAAGIAMLVLGRDQKVVMINERGAGLVGYQKNEMFGRNWFDNFMPKEMRIPAKEIFNKLISGELRKEYIEMPILTKEGNQVPVAWYNSILKDEQGNITGTISAGEDITSRERAQAMEQIAYYDIVTGLPNQSLFNERLEQAIGLNGKIGRKAAVLLLALDKFDAVNKKLGRDAGDYILLKVGERIQEIINDTDTVARIDGDEFNIAISGLEKKSDIDAVTNKILNQLSKGFDFSGRPIKISASIGVSFYPDDGNDLIKLADKADEALLRAKEQGGDRVVFYS